MFSYHIVFSFFLFSSPPSKNPQWGKLDVLQLHLHIAHLLVLANLTQTKMHEKITIQIKTGKALISYFILFKIWWHKICITSGRIKVW